MGIKLDSCIYDEVRRFKAYEMIGYPFKKINMY